MNEQKIHINKKGEPAPCHATLKDCPIGGEHFNSYDDAYKSIARDNNNITSLRKDDREKNETPLQKSLELVELLF